MSRSTKTLGKALSAGLRTLPPELAHHFVVKGLSNKVLAGVVRFLAPSPASPLPSVVSGLGSLSHPIGLAAGFDKSAECFRGLAHLGFSFIEVGTVTPQPQVGNPKPRLFRLPEQRALINRMGFNNHGLEQVCQRVEAAGRDRKRPPLGINIGINKTTPLSRALDDYLQGFRRVHGLGDYVVINVSSPNTPELRKLANPDFIRELALAITREMGREALSHLWIKLDPDLSKKDLQALVQAIAEEQYAGVILTNTHKVALPQAGGLSGHPLAIASTSCLEWAWEVHRGSLTMIGGGGIFSGEDVLQKIIRGASCVQIYTAMIYRGPWLVWELMQEFREAMQLRGFTTIDEMRGSYYH